MFKFFLAIQMMQNNCPKKIASIEAFYFTCEAIYTSDKWQPSAIAIVRTTNNMSSINLESILRYS